MKSDKQLFETAVGIMKVLNAFMLANVIAAGIMLLGFKAVQEGLL